MKKILYFALFALVLGACGKDDTEENTDPNNYRQRILGDWIQYRMLRVRHYDGKIDTAITSKITYYWKFTENKCYHGSNPNALVGSAYEIIGDSISYNSSPEHIEFVGDSLKFQYNRWDGPSEYHTILVLHRLSNK